MKYICKEITADQIFELIGDRIDLDPAGCHTLTSMPADYVSGVVTCFVQAKRIDSVEPFEVFLNIPIALFEQVLGEGAKDG